MRLQLIEKLSSTILIGFKTEKDIFYFLGQSRKLLETQFQRKEWEEKYPTLSLVCDWAMHSQISGRAARNKLKQYSDYLLSEARSVGFGFMTKEFKLFPDLEADISTFCISNGLNNSFVVKKRLWKKFISLLVRVLMDFPLINEDEKVRFAFNKGFSVGKREGISFTINYDDGRSYSYTVDINILSHA